MVDDKLRPPPACSLPWIIYTHGYDESKQAQTFITAPFNNKSSLRSIPELQGKLIIGSQFGWLILKKNESAPGDFSITLCNPVTLKSIDLPLLHYLREDEVMLSCFLTSPPSDSNCFLLMFFLGRVFCCPCWPNRINDAGSSWVDESIEIGGDRVFIRMAATLNEVVYGWALTDIFGRRAEYLVSFEVAKDGSNTITFRPLGHRLPDRPFSIILDTCHNFMVESCGRLYIAQAETRRYDEVHKVKVFELDLEQGVSIEVKSLGDRAFFLALEGCTWCFTSTSCESTTECIEGNCLYIYLPAFLSVGVMLYRLDDCSLTFLPCPKLLHPRFSRPAWVMPRPQSSRAGYEPNHSMEKDGVVIKTCLGTNSKKCKVLAQENETQETHLSKLPLHLVELLSKYMHLFDYWNFRCTCKIFQSVMPAPQWRTHNWLPLFLVQENAGGLCRLVDPCRDYSRSFRLQFSQDCFDIEFSKDGWLLIFDGKSLHFFNPFTKARGSLPRPPRRYSHIGFSTNPTSSKCMTIAISIPIPETGIFIDYLRSGDTQWSSRRIEDRQGIPFCQGYGTPIYYSGAFYFLDVVGCLGVFELVDDDSCTWRVYDKPFAKNRKFHSCSLVESDEKLLSVFIMKRGEFILVLEFDHLKKKWVHVESLGDHILFISPYSSFSVKTKDIKMKDRIYLPWMKDKSVIYYSLETKKYHVYDNEDSGDDFFFMKQPSKCCWI